MAHQPAAGQRGRGCVTLGRGCVSLPCAGIPGASAPGCHSRVGLEASRVPATRCQASNRLFKIPTHEAREGLAARGTGRQGGWVVGTGWSSSCGRSRCMRSASGGLPGRTGGVRGGASCVLPAPPRTPSTSTCTARPPRQPPAPPQKEYKYVRRPPAQSLTACGARVPATRPVTNPRHPAPRTTHRTTCRTSALLPPIHPAPPRHSPHYQVAPVPSTQRPSKPAPRATPRRPSQLPCFTPASTPPPGPPCCANADTSCESCQHA